MTRTSLEVWQDLRPPSPGLISRYPGLHRIVASLPQSLPRLKNCSSKIYTENTCKAEDGAHFW
jgi:hypothetical protein